jgi:hypothetical protein
MRLSSTPPTKTPAYKELLPHAELLRILDDLADSVMLDTGRAALVVGVTANTLNHWRTAGKPPPFAKIGAGRTSIVRYRLGDLRKFLSSNTFTDTATALDAAARLIDTAAKHHADTEETDQPKGHAARRDYLLDAMAPFWVRERAIVDVALSRHVNFLENFQDEKIKVLWMSWREALGRLWSDETIWRVRMHAAEAVCATRDVDEIALRHKARMLREQIKTRSGDIT